MGLRHKLLRNKVFLGVVISFFVSLVFGIGTRYIVLNILDDYRVHNIFRSESSFGEIFVNQSKKYRCITFSDGKGQSCISIANPNHQVQEYTKLMMGGIYLNENPKHVLMLGIGGGIISNSLLELFPEIQIDMVHINPAILEIAKRFFLIKDDKRISIFIDDANHFMKLNKRHYDMIFIDVFTEDYVPGFVLTKEFMKLIKKSLNVKGVVVSNTFANSQYSLKENVLFKSVFGAFYKVKGVDSTSLIAKNGALPPILDLIKASNTWKERFKKIGIEDNFIISKFELVN